MKKAAIYDPYLDTLGGGERYCLSVAKILKKHGYDVDIFWSKDDSILEKATSRFSLDLTGINLVPDVFGLSASKLEIIEESPRFDQLKSIIKKNNIIKKYFHTRKYDIFFYLSDGSLPFLFSKNNILHIQVPFPFHTNDFDSALTKIKLKLINKIICNSQFTAKISQTYLPKKSYVLYPPVDVDKFINLNQKKEKIILNVGRFDSILNSKRQDVLIEGFKQLINNNDIKDWRLILAGGSLTPEKNSQYINHLKKISQNYQIEFVINPDFSKLTELYSISSIYWHAAGYQINEETEPQHTEHFGMTTVESMASGLVPVVVARGGLPEIVTSGNNGYLWSTIDELVEYTNNLINNPNLIQKFSKQARMDCQNYSLANFENKFINLLGL